MDDSRTIRAAAVQISPVLFSRDGTTEKVLQTIANAAKTGAQLVVFPETFIPYYPYFSFVQPPVLMGKEHMRLYEQAVEIPSPVTDAISRAARSHTIVVVVGVNERDHGSLYNTQLVFDADGRLLLKRRKITPTYHERMVWGQGDGAGLKTLETAVGQLGVLACWEHYNPLARFALMAQHEQIHCSQFPGSMVGQIFTEQIEVTIRHHALESGCFVVNATGWLSPEQVTQITPDERLQRVLSGGCYTAIINPEGTLLCSPVTEGEGMAIADLDFSLITKRKRMMDCVGHYARPDLLQLQLNPSQWSVISQTSPVMAMPDASLGTISNQSTEETSEKLSEQPDEQPGEQATINRVGAIDNTKDDEQTAVNFSPSVSRFEAC
ncbi:MAG: Nit6803 family nitriliase [Cyanobacteria bacterium CRU_2_1]|nr:Nit6803 family nitriliase [Cyanobacteria bacterium RU_5_0]NJR63536.1 Nit6803 family nitriliase [Cyanobacteria bacterium CRU_2_1]